MPRYSITKATLGRLPQYLNLLKGLEETTETISATTIAKKLSLGEVQVRKDLALVSGAGKPKIGYGTATLIKDIEKHLGNGKQQNAVLVGVGKLGKALLDYNGFAEFGIDIIAGFDCNEHAITINNSEKEILPISSLSDYCKKHDVKLGIITVGQGSAQEVSDCLVSSGIKAIWNFAPCSLTIPNGVLLKQENLALSLAYLNNQIC